MMQQILNFALEHVGHIISGISYALLEYYIGKTKKIEANSLLELIQKQLWRK